MIDATWPRDWCLTAISEVADVIMGQSPPSTTYNTDGEGLPFFQGKAEFGDESPIPVKWCTAPTRIAEPNDILLSIRAPVGATNVATETCGIGRGLAALRAIPELLEPLYLLYALRLLEPILVNRGRGSTFDAINRKDIESVKIPLPPLSEQRRIVDILRQADNLRRLRCEADARMADFQASLYCQMFGDPLKNERKWELKRIRQLGTVMTGNTPSRKNPNYYGDYIDWVKTNDLSSPLGLVTRSAERLSKQGAEIARVAPKDSTLVACIAGSLESIGRTAITDREVAFNQQINAVIPFEHVNPYFLYFTVNMAQPLVQANATRGMKKIINKSRFEDLSLIFPPKDLQDGFELRAMQAIDIFKTQVDSYPLLEDLFQSFLAHAFTGELTAAWREQNAERLQEEAAQRDMALGLQPRQRVIDIAAELDTPGGQEVFDQQVQALLQPAAEQLVEAVTPTVRLDDIVEIEALVNLNQLVSPVSSAYRMFVNSSLLRGVEQISEAVQLSLAGSLKSVQALAQSAVEEYQQQIVELAVQLAQMAALVTRRLDEEHPRYHSLRALSDEQYGVYLAALQSDGYFTAESVLAESNLPVDNVRRTLALLET